MWAVRMLAMMATPRDTPICRCVEKIQLARPVSAGEIVRRSPPASVRTEAHAQTAEEHQAADGPEAGVEADLGERGDGQTGGEKATGHQSPRPDPPVDAPGDERRDHDPERLWEGRQAARQGILAAQQLEIQRHHERQPEKLADPDQPGKIAEAEHVVRQQPQIEHGLSTLSSVYTNAIVRGRRPTR